MSANVTELKKGARSTGSVIHNDLVTLHSLSDYIQNKKLMHHKMPSVILEPNPEGRHEIEKAFLLSAYLRNIIQQLIYRVHR